MTGDDGSSSNGFPSPLAEKGLLPLVSSSDQSALFSILLTLDRQTKQLLRKCIYMSGPLKLTGQSSMPGISRNKRKVYTTRSTVTTHKKPVNIRKYTDLSCKHSSLSSKQVENMLLYWIKATRQAFGSGSMTKVLRATFRSRASNEIMLRNNKTW